MENIIDGIKYRLDDDNMTAEVIEKSDGYEGGINIEYMYSFAGENGRAQIGFKTNTPETAVAILEKAGAKVL